MVIYFLKCNYKIASYLYINFISTLHIYIFEQPQTIYIVFHSTLIFTIKRVYVVKTSASKHQQVLLL